MAGPGIWTALKCMDGELRFNRGEKKEREKDEESFTPHKLLTLSEGEGK